MEDESNRYTIEVRGLSPKADLEDVYRFFLNCGNIKSVTTIRCHPVISITHVDFKEAYSVKIALFLSGSEIAGKPVTISSCGKNNVDPSPYVVDVGSDSVATSSDKSASTPGEAVIVVQEVVKTMILKGYVLSKDAMSKAKAFDKSQVSSARDAEVADRSKKIGLTDKIRSGMDAVKSVDEKYHVCEMTKSAASHTGKTAVAAANVVVNSSYFAKGALWVSDVLDRGAKAAADLGNRGLKK